jgi:hypothetical protein
VNVPQFEQTPVGVGRASVKWLWIVPALIVSGFVAATAVLAWLAADVGDGMLIKAVGIFMPGLFAFLILGALTGTTRSSLTEHEKACDRKIFLAFVACAVMMCAVWWAVGLLGKTPNVVAWNEASVFSKVQQALAECKQVEPDDLRKIVFAKGSHYCAFDTSGKLQFSSSGEKLFEKSPGLADWLVIVIKDIQRKGPTDWVVQGRRVYAVDINFSVVVLNVRTGKTEPVGKVTLKTDDRHSPYYEIRLWINTAP